MKSKVGDLLTYEEFIDLAKYAISRLDGAWVRVIGAKHGMDDAAALDVEAWEDWMERVAKVIRKKLHLDGRGVEAMQEDFPRVGVVLGALLGNTSEMEFPPDGSVINRITQCEFWEGIKKAGFDQFAKAGMLCANVHVAGYKGMLKGLYPGQKFEITHTKRIPDGAPCCEVVIKPLAKRRK